MSAARDWLHAMLARCPATRYERPAKACRPLELADGVEPAPAAKPAALVSTWSGRRVDVFDPDPAQIHMIDIATALSRQCRYNGHTSSFYSVAQHCVLVSELVPPGDALAGLLHDAAEAYLPDVSCLIKPHLPGFEALENSLLAVIFGRFGLALPLPASVLRMDARIRSDEAFHFMGDPADWTGMARPIGLHLRAWCMEEARARFLERYMVLSRDRDQRAEVPA